VFIGYLYALFQFPVTGNETKDSVKAMTAQDELNVLKRKYDESQQIIQEKEDTLRSNNV